MKKEGGGRRGGVARRAHDTQYRSAGGPGDARRDLRRQGNACKQGAGASSAGRRGPTGADAGGADRDRLP